MERGVTFVILLACLAACRPRTVMTLESPAPVPTEERFVGFAPSEATLTPAARDEIGAWVAALPGWSLAIECASSRMSFGLAHSRRRMLYEFLVTIGRAPSSLGLVRQGDARAREEDIGCILRATAAP